MDKTLKKPVKDFMTTDVVAVEEGESIKNLFKILDKNGIVGVPVVNDKLHVTGVITETDLIKHFTTLETPRSINLLGGIIYLDNPSEYNQHLKEHCAENVKDLMTQPAITVDESAQLIEVINLMSNKDISRLPVVNKKHELVGIISKSDVVHQLAKLKIV